VLLDVLLAREAARAAGVAAIVTRNTRPCLASLMTLHNPWEGCVENAGPRLGEFVLLGFRTNLRFALGRVELAVRRLCSDLDALRGGVKYDG